MNPQKAREIVVEFERVQIVTRRCATRLLRCYRCRSVRDFLTLAEAARIFDVKVDILVRFVNHSGSHFREEQGDTFLCLDSLLAAMKVRADLSTTIEAIDTSDLEQLSE